VEWARYISRQHPRLPRRDALKILPIEVSVDEDYRARFEREADLASTLWHPHIVGVHDRGEADGQLWISMDFVDGRDASQLIEDKYPVGMPADEVAAIITVMASALDYAHQQGCCASQRQLRSLVQYRCNAVTPHPPTTAHPQRSRPYRRLPRAVPSWDRRRSRAGCRFLGRVE
jgi:serine/threonine protein kinase